LYDPPPGRFGDRKDLFDKIVERPPIPGDATEVARRLAEHPIRERVRWWALMVFVFLLCLAALAFGLFVIGVFR
jgi:hypothetical protein